MVKLERCKGKTSKNIKCKIKTSHPSGFCRHHRITVVSYNTSDFPLYNGSGYLTSEKFSIRKYSKSGKKKSTLNMPNEEPEKGGKCGNCGNLNTILVDSYSGGNREGFRIEWEYYCPQCKKYTFIEQLGDYS